MATIFVLAAYGNGGAPRCPKCQAPMDLKTRSDGSGRQFWGCSTWRATGCKGFLPYKAPAAGAPAAATPQPARPVPSINRPAPSATGDVPSCPQCGGRMVRRQTRDGKREFWGCSNFRDGCRGSREIGDTGQQAAPASDPNDPFSNQPTTLETQKPRTDTWWHKLSRVPWYLAKRKSDGKLLAVQKDVSGWLGLEQNSDLPPQPINIADIDRVTNPDGKVYAAFTPIKLLESYKADGGKVEDDKQIPAVSKPQSKNPWTLAKAVDIYVVGQGDPVLLRQGANGWEWMSKLFETGDLDPAQDISKAGEIVKNEAGQPIQGDNPKELFDIFKKMFPSQGYALDQYKAAIANDFEKTDKNLMVDALAGTGKTTTLKSLTKFMKPGEKWLYLVFNKKNQIEASEQEAFKGVTVLTSHAYAKSVLDRSANYQILPSTDYWKGSGERLSNIVMHTFETDRNIAMMFPRKLQWEAKKVILAICTEAKRFSVNPMEPDIEARLAAVVKENYIDTDIMPDDGGGFDMQSMDYTPQLIKASAAILKINLPGQAPANYTYKRWDPDQQMEVQETVNLNDFRDHNDTVWWSSLMSDKLLWDKYDVVMVDEVQDFNKCQIAIVRNLQRRGARIVCVGDPNQALYLFNGASPDAFNEIKSLVQGGAQGATDRGLSHPLPINYRSGTAIIDWANQNTEIGQKDNKLIAGAKHKGRVEEDVPKEEVLARVMGEWRNGRKLRMQTAFMCYTNAPLVKAAMDFIKADVDFEYIGKDLAPKLIKTVENVTGRGRRFDNMPIANVKPALQQYYNDKYADWHDKLNKAEDLKELEDFTESMVAILDHLASIGYEDKRLRFRIGDAKTLMQYLKKRFAGRDEGDAKAMKELKQRDPLSYVTLTTVHKAKGMEYSRVFLMEPGTFQPTKKDNPKSIAQKGHGFYVAATRPIYEFIVMRDDKEDKDDSGGADSYASSNQKRVYSFVSDVAKYSRERAMDIERWRGLVASKEIKLNDVPAYIRLYVLEQLRAK